MPEAARGNGTDSVNTVHNSVGLNCAVAPQVIATAACSGDVFVNGIGSVRQTDAVQAHTFPGCGTHNPGLTSFSSTVFINGLGAGRNGDSYGCGATITSGSNNVNIGG